MRWSTHLRVSKIVWIAPLIALAVAFLDTGIELSNEGYGPAVVANRLMVVAFIAPLAALAAAWDGNHLRRSGALGQPRVRSAVAITYRPLLICLVPPLLILLINLGATAGLTNVLANPAMVLVSCLALVGWTVFSFGLGLWLHPAVSLPTSLSVPVWWMLVTAAMEPLWLRHLSASWEGCCAVSTAVAPGALLGAGLVGMSLVVSGALQIWWVASSQGPSRRLPFSAMIAAVPLAAGFLLGAALVNDLGPNPTVQRTSGLHCIAGDPEVCIFAEHLGRGKEFQVLAADAAVRWREYGIAVPNAFRADLVESSPDAARFRVGLTWDTTAVVGSLAQGISWQAACAPDLHPEVIFTTETFVQTWLMRTAGISSAEIRESGVDDALDDVNELLSVKSRSEQGQIINEYLSFGNSCLAEGG